jgi:hypothetical protein
LIEKVSLKAFLTNADLPSKEIYHLLIQGYHPDHKNIISHLKNNPSSAGKSLASSATLELIPYSYQKSFYYNNFLLQNVYYKTEDQFYEVQPSSSNAMIHEYIKNIKCLMNQFNFKHILIYILFISNIFNEQLLLIF